VCLARPSQHAGPACYIFVVGAADRTLACPECGSSYLQGVKFCAECGIPLGDVDVDLGTLVGSYRLIEVLGEGGMGRVYVAEHVKLGRRVAVKKLRSELASNATAVARFFSEARAVNRISHENIVEITDFLEHPGGDNYIIMELLKGEDLAHRLQRKRILPLPRAFDIAAQTASALSAVHAAGMIHRDLKPDNIFLIERGGNPDFVKVLDFGVAKLTDTSDRGGIAMHVTAAGQIIGTPEYMSPEQAGGLAVDFRTDIYALGVILYEMITGDLPFQAKSFGELLIQHMTSPVELPRFAPGLPYGIQSGRDQLLLDLLAKNPKDRPRSMTEIELRIRGLIESMDLPPPPKKRQSDRAPTINERAEPTPTSLARLALKKLPTPQVVVEIGTPRSVSRIEVPTPVGVRGAAAPTTPPPAGPGPGAQNTPIELPRAGAERLAKSSSTDAQSVMPPMGRPGVGAPPERDATPSDLRRSGRLQVSGSNPGISMPESAGQRSPSERSGSRPIERPGAVKRGSNPGIGLPDRAPLRPAIEVNRSGGSNPGMADRDVLRPGIEVNRSGGSNAAIAIPDRADPGAALEVRPGGGSATVDVPDPLLDTKRGWVSYTASPGPKPSGRSRAHEPRAGIGLSPAIGTPLSTNGPELVLTIAADTGDDLVVEARGEPVAIAAIARAAPVAVEPTSARLSRPDPAAPVTSAAVEPTSARLSRPAAEPAPTPTRSRRTLWIGALAVVAAAGLVARELREPVGPAVAPSPLAVAPQAPAAQLAEIRIKFVSAPSGATVRLVATGETLGITPFTQSFPRSDHSARFEFSRVGFATVVQDLTLVTDDALAATLAPIAAVAPTPAPAAPIPDPPRKAVSAKRPSPPAPDRPVDRNGTLDVFKQK